MRYEEEVEKGMGVLPWVSGRRRRNEFDNAEEECKMTHPHIHF